MQEKRVVFRYRLNQEGRKASLLAGGNGQEIQEIVADLTPEILDLATVRPDGQPVLEVGFNSTCELDTRPIACFRKPGWTWHAERGPHYFSAPQTVQSLIAWEKARLERLAHAKTDPANLAEIARLEEAWAKRQEEDEKRRKEMLERAAAIKAAQQRREEEKSGWIEAHGSDHLRRAHALGYDCQRRYVTERAAREFPGWVVDFDDCADWRERSCPSAEALRVVEELINRGLNAKVVWLTAPPYKRDPEEEYYEPFEAREAVVILGYLGSYTLVKEIS